MIPEATWTYIVARVREEFPDTVFMLEGLGGKLEVTDALLSRAGLDWAYSEIFQTYDRGQFEWYLPGAIARAERLGTLVHFAETHANDRLAKGGETYARLRVALAALLSHQGAWGIANGVEWFATEKIDVHGKNDLAWGHSPNLVELIARLNELLRTHPDFTLPIHLEMIARGAGNFLAVKRGETLVLANLDCAHGVMAQWDTSRYGAGEATELLSGRTALLSGDYGLAPGEILCFSRAPRTVHRPVAAANKAHRSATAAVVWHWPQDARREVCVPDGMSLAFAADCACRTRLFDANRTWPELPPYEGDGTAARRLSLEFTAFTPEGVRRTVSPILVLPPAGKARVTVQWRENVKDVQIAGGTFSGTIPGFERQTVLVDPAKPLSLAVSGLVFQAVLRNSLAEPYLLGVSGGAGLGAAGAILLGFSAWGFMSVPLFALLGAVTANVLVFAAVRRRTAEELLLGGVMIGTLASSLLMVLITFSHSRDMAGVVWWMLGSVQNVDPARQLAPAAVLLAAATVFLLFRAGDVDLLTFGAEYAWNHGVNARVMTVVLLALASLLAAVTVSMAGIIGFCGLVVPHIVRRLHGGSHRKILIPAALAGAAFLMLADILGRVVSPVRELPVGMVTAAVGCPVFLWLLNRSRAGS